jgi:acyl transferase domain-containing protein
LRASGYTKDSLKGQYIHHYSADGTRDTEFQDKRIWNVNARWSAHYTVAMVVNHTLGLTGLATTVDTACSAANSAMNSLYTEMVGTRDAKKQGLATTLEICRTGLLTGSCPLTSPLPFIGLSQGRMLGKMGRCQTYNDSASGFARGEGFSALVAQSRNEVKASLDQAMAAIGGNVNQDGRSASLTAPNGPSQSAVIRACLRSANITPVDVAVTELHGTGTALGDPIEVGSMRAVMAGPNVNRVAPLPNNAGKSNTGHTEFNAGCNGFIKTILVYKLCASPPNVHLKVLNKNIEEIGYPALFSSESVDVGMDNFIAGVCSFGFGGTNARMEFWGRSALAAHSVSPYSKLQDGSGAVARIQQNQGRSLNFDKLFPV